MTYRIDIVCESAVAEVWVQGVETAVAATLSHEAVDEDAAVALLFTDDLHIQQLNQSFLGIDKPTDVLSFAAGENLPGMEDSLSYLGDIAISIPYAARQAAAASHPLLAELQLLAIHGTLHLLGFDHDTPQQKTAMWTAQTAVLSQLGLPNISPKES